MVARKRSAEDLSEDELRHLLLEKRRLGRQERLDDLRRTGRVVDPDLNSRAGRRPFRRPGTGSEADEAVNFGSRAGSRPGKQRHAFDTVLFLVEIAAVLGLLFVLWNGVTILRDLNREFAAALRVSIPTPMTTAVVLPSGHTPPGAPGGASPTEIGTLQFLPMVSQGVESASAPASSAGQAIRIQIPAIEIDAPVVQGDDWEQLKNGVGVHAGSPDPGQPGNLILSAHNDVFGELFRDLDRLNVGDTFTLYTDNGQFVYTITGTRIVAPTQVDVMDATEQPTATLISCYPYLIDNKRIVVKAELQINS